MDHHRNLAVRLMEIIMAIEMNVFGKTNVRVLCLGVKSRQFYKHSLTIFYAPSPNPDMLNVKIMQGSSLSCASACSQF